MIAWSRIGLGAGALGDARLGEEDADRLVRGAIDLGVTVIDTAPSYGSSEARLGRILGPDRARVVLITKGGYGVEGVPDWTGEVIRRGVDAALGRLRTDVLDAFLLHSCDRGTLERGDVVEALVEAKRAGKIRMTGYSGDGDALDWAAARRDLFDVLECSVSPLDQANLGRVERAASAGFVVLAKRPLANAPWLHPSRPERGDIATYWDRLHAIGFDPAPLSWEALSARFAAFAPGVRTALVGTSRVAHLEAAARAIEAGPLDAPTLSRLRGAFDARGQGWGGVI